MKTLRGAVLWGGRSPVGNVARTDYFDDRGEVYYTCWGRGAPPPLGPADPVPAATGSASAGRSPLGNVCRTVLFDDAGEPYYVVWQAAPPALAVPVEDGPAAWPEAGAPALQASAAG